jgi:hypothetical protein
MLKVLVFVVLLFAVLCAWPQMTLVHDFIHLTKDMAHKSGAKIKDIRCDALSDKGGYKYGFCQFSVDQDEFEKIAAKDFTLIAPDHARFDDVMEAVMDHDAVSDLKRKDYCRPGEHTDFDFYEHRIPGQNLIYHPYLKIACVKFILPGD